MIHWAWLILAFVVGGNVGLLIMAAIACGRESDRMMEARYEDRECYGIGDGIGTTGPRGNGCDEEDYRPAAAGDRHPTGRD